MPAMPGHALVGDQQRDLLAAGADLAEQIERLGARAGAQDPVALPEPAPQVARDGRQHRGLVIDGNDRRASFGGHHGESTNACNPGLRQVTASRAVTRA